MKNLRPLLRAEFSLKVDQDGRTWIYAKMRSEDGRVTTFGAEGEITADQLRQQLESSIRRLGVYTPLF